MSRKRKRKKRRAKTEQFDASGMFRLGRPTPAQVARQAEAVDAASTAIGQFRSKLPKPVGDAAVARAALARQKAHDATPTPTENHTPGSGQDWWREND